MQAVATQSYSMELTSVMTKDEVNTKSLLFKCVTIAGHIYIFYLSNSLHKFIVLAGLLKKRKLENTRER
jgi:hypothetical protein